MSRLDGKLAIVTGSASGIGRQIALRFAREGANVADEEQVGAGVDEVAARLGGVDILVSNAGIQHIAPLVDLPLADWRKILAVHLDGAFLTTRACLRHMIRQGHGGTVLYIGSVHSVEASPLKAPYVTAKHGLIGLA